MVEAGSTLSVCAWWAILPASSQAILTGPHEGHFFPSDKCRGLFAVQGAENLQKKVSVHGAEKLNYSALKAKIRVTIALDPKIGHQLQIL